MRVRRPSLRVWSARAVAVKYNSCYAQPATSAAIKKCNKTYHMRKELTARNSDDVCQSVSISLSLSLSLSLCLTLCLCLLCLVWRRPPEKSAGLENDRIAELEKRAYRRRACVSACQAGSGTYTSFPRSFFITISVTVNNGGLDDTLANCLLISSFQFLFCRSVDPQLQSIST